SEIELMFGVLAVWHIRDGIETVRVLVDSHLEETVRPEQLPSGQDLPIGEWLDAVSPSAHLVIGHEGDNDIGGYGIGFEKRRTRFCGPQVSVIVIEGRDVQRKFAVRLDAITNFIRQQVLGSKLIVAIDGYDDRQRAVERRYPGWNNRLVQPQALFG